MIRGTVAVVRQIRGPTRWSPVSRAGRRRGWSSDYCQRAANSLLAFTAANDKIVEINGIRDLDRVRQLAVTVLSQT
ncbi:hypothetical protein ACIHFD_65740 [Nonomuraea sp. NPDC051941]|uniref:hypothetical protein n=1 Tax=Nonomuraea sp. NPDC051941 TaxID=3364373 RepID=UPI0037CABA82